MAWVGTTHIIMNRHCCHYPLLDVSLFPFLENHSCSKGIDTCLQREGRGGSDCLSQVTWSPFKPLCPRVCIHALSGGWIRMNVSGSHQAVHCLVCLCWAIQDRLWSSIAADIFTRKCSGCMMYCTQEGSKTCVLQNASLSDQSVGKSKQPHNHTTQPCFQFLLWRMTHFLQYTYIHIFISLVCLLRKPSKYVSACECQCLRLYLLRWDWSVGKNQQVSAETQS